MSREISASGMVDIIIKVADNAPDDVLSRALTEEWQSYYYKMEGLHDVVEHLFFNCVSNGIEDASRLDGWADLEREMLTFHVTNAEIDWVDAAQIAEFVKGLSND